MAQGESRSPFGPVERKSMLNPIKVTLELRGEKYVGEITDADGLLFLSTIFNAEENRLMELGRIQDATLAYKRRGDERLEELKSQGKSDEDLLSEWGQHLLNRVERDPDIRSLVASRIKERFPGIPRSLIRWDGKNDFAINLHIVELLQLLNGIIVPSMKLLESSVSENKKTPEPESETVEPLQQGVGEGEKGKSNPTPEPAAIVPVVVEPEQSEIDQRILQLKEMLAQSEQQKAILEQERQRQNNAIALESTIIQQQQN